MNLERISAYLGLSYVITSIVYIVLTRHLGTPFKNAVSKYPDLVKIKKDSVQKRYRAFYIGCICAVVIMYFWSPFE